MQFGDVTIREYEIILGDHPYCDYYPISISDNYYNSEVSVNLEIYETQYRRSLYSSCWEKPTPTIPKLDAVQRRTKLIEFHGVEMIEEMERKRLNENNNNNSNNNIQQKPVLRRIPALPPNKLEFYRKIS